MRDIKLFTGFVVLSLLVACGFQMQGIRVHDPDTGDEMTCKPSAIPGKMECFFSVDGGNQSGSFLVDSVSVDEWLKKEKDGN